MPTLSSSGLSRSESSTVADVKDIQDTIVRAFPGAKVYMANPMDDGDHLQAIVISDAFGGMLLLKQHRAVMDALKQEFSEGLHSITLKTFVPDEWEQVKDQYNTGE